MNAHSPIRARRPVSAYVLTGRESGRPDRRLGSRVCVVGALAGTRPYGVGTPPVNVVHAALLVPATGWAVGFPDSHK